MPKQIMNILCGDSACLPFPDDHFDCLVTDPPYGYGFMGKDWDKVVVPSSTWREILRVMKPGAFGFVMSAPRQDVLARMIVNLQDAGFETGFTSIYWTYATGFPKAMNVGKAVDKRLGIERKIIGEYQAPDGGKRDLSKHKPHKEARQADHEYGYKTSGFRPIDRGNSHLEGAYAGFQPKPAVEVILVVMKPLTEKGYLDQAMKDGKGVTWLEAGRIPIEGEAGVWGSSNEGCKPTFCDSESVHEYRSSRHPQGRFPANLLVSDDVLDQRTSRGDTGTFSRYFDLDAWWEKLPKSVRNTFPFLIVPKASKSEKNRGCDGLEVKERRTMGCGLTGISGDRTGKTDRTKPINAGENKLKNHHPTVKPVKLMSYLIAIGSRTGDLILDPFMGSGTTLVAANGMGRQAVGVENDPECLPVAEARLKGTMGLKKPTGLLF